MMMPFEIGMAGSGVMVPDVRVLIEGMPLAAPVLKSIMHVSVSQLESGPSAFTLQINDPLFELTDAVRGVFMEGKRVEIMMGYVGSTRTMIVGDIETLSVELDEGGGSTIHAMGYDRLHAGTRGTEYREFKPDIADSEIVNQIAAALQLTPSVESTSPRIGQQKQNNMTNLKFLEDLAERNNFKLWVDGSTLNFREKKNVQQISVSRGRDLISFSASLSTSGHVDSIEVRGWNASEKKEFSATVEASQVSGYTSKLTPTGQAQLKAGGSGKSKRVIYADHRVNTIAEAQKLAEKLMSDQRSGLISASGSAVGNTDIQAGASLKLVNMGRFSGDYVVETANHEIGSTGYRTAFTLRTEL